ncbi:MAG: energy transducer TonB [Terracidiphilus sp.]
MTRFHLPWWAVPVARSRVFLLCGLAALLLVPASVQGRLQAQQAADAPAANSQPAPPSTTTSQPAPSSDTTSHPAQAPAPVSPEDQPALAPTIVPGVSGSASISSASISEDQLRKLLEGKDLFIRGGYLDNTLAFNEHGVLIGHSAQGSYTLCGIRINKVRLLKHKVELEGARYGLHFLGASPGEDPTKAVDRVNITPKKKAVRITIDRELVLKPKSQKGKGKGVPPASKPAPIASQPATAAAPPADVPAAPAAAPDVPDVPEAQAKIAEAPEAERPADANSVTTTFSPAHANQLLQQALDNIFAQGFDARMMAAMPAFWTLYYQAVAEKADYRPQDPNVLGQNMVDKKARLVSSFVPASNQFAQDYGVAGMTEYHVVVDADGKPQEIVVARPIGFGLDENAVDAIREATFEPAVKDGKPVPVMLDLVVQFRIYSQRTAMASAPVSEHAPQPPSLPGPYSAQH